MIGVRRPSRVVRSDQLRGLLVVAAFVAVGMGYHGHDGLQGAGKSTTDPKFVDPFLAEDVAAPGDDEIPGIPDVELPRTPRKSNARKKAEPKRAAVELGKPSASVDSSESSDLLELNDASATDAPASGSKSTSPTPTKPKKKTDIKTPPEDVLIDEKSDVNSPNPEEMDFGESLPSTVPHKKQAGKSGAKSKPDSTKSPFAELELNDDAAPQRLPTMETPRLTRDIKKTTAPNQSADPDLNELDLLGTPDQPKIRSLKNVPTLGKTDTAKSETERANAGTAGAGKSDWKSFAVEAANSADSAKGASSGPSAESARFEQSGDIQDLSEPIEKIVVEGNKTIKTEEIKKLIKTREGRVADPKQIKEDVRTLVAKRWFFDVETRIAQSKDGPGKVLVFRVTEKPMLKSITYIGNKKIKEKALNECHMLKVNGGYDVGANREAVHRIESLYQEKGYLHATVELEKGDSNDERDVVFRINEGPKVVVNQITFSGNSYFSTAVLKTQIKTKKVILWLFGGKYDHASVEEDVHLLKQYYHNLGFFDVQVRDKVSESSDRSKIHVEYIIEEGVRFKVRNIEFVGNRVLSEEKLRKDLKVKRNDAYAQRFVDVDKNKIVAQYGELGRINATVNPLTRSFEEPGYIDLVYEINEDRPYRIGRIHVHINGDHPHTKESVVLTKLTFKPGELASRAKIDKSKLRLKGSGLFAGGNPGQGQSQQGAAPPEIVLRPSELPTPRTLNTQGRISVARGQDEAVESPRRAGRKSAPVTSSGSSSEPSQVRSQDRSQDGGVIRGQNPGNTPFENLPFGESPEGPEPDAQYQEEPAYIDAIVNVFETQTGRLNMGIGVNSNAGLQGNITLEENNFDILRPPTSLQEIIDGTAWRGGGQQFRIEAMPGLQLSRYLVSWRDPFFLDQNVMLGVSGYYNNRYFINWTERREGGKVILGHQFNPYWSGTVTMRAEDVRITNPSVPVPPDYQAVLGDTFLSTAMAALINDTRDHPMMPGSGHYVEASVEQGIADFVYQKYHVDARQHFLLKERPDGGSRHILSFYGNAGWIDGPAPFYERFFAGGFGMGGTFRGFQFQGVGPRFVGVRIGGVFQALGTIEYQIPITADNTIQVVTFTDLGTVDSSVTFANYRQTVGAGLRLMVPMLGPVPIAVDFGVPIRHVPGDSLQVISFNMGAAR